MQKKKEEIGENLRGVEKGKMLRNKDLDWRTLVLSGQQMCFVWPSQCIFLK